MRVTLQHFVPQLQGKKMTTFSRTFVYGVAQWHGKDISDQSDRDVASIKIGR